MSDKKKFKETKVGQFLLQKLPKVFNAVAEDSLPAKVIEALIGGSTLPPEDKSVALKKLELERAEIDGITKRWVADAQSGSWLSSNVRPLTLAFLTVAFVIGWAYQLEGLDTVKSLLQIVFMGYFGSRGFEKVMGNNRHK